MKRERPDVRGRQVKFEPDFFGIEYPLWCAVALRPSICLGLVLFAEHPL